MNLTPFYSLILSLFVVSGFSGHATLEWTVRFSNGLWDLEEGSGDTAYDISSNENNGTIIGATYSDDTPEQECSTGCTATTSVYVNLINVEIEQNDTSICFGNSVVLGLVNEQVTDTLENINSFNYMGCFEGNKYYFSDYTCSWTTAENDCQQNGGHLLTINSSEEQNFIESITTYGPNIHIGANNTSNWITGDVISYSNWNSNDLTNSYGEFYWNTFQWGMDPNSSQHRICLEIENQENCYQETNGLWSTGETSNSIVVSPEETTTYWVDLTEDGVTCTDSITITVNNPQANLPDSISTCDSSVLLEADPGYNYLWSTGETTQSIMVEESGVYEVTVGDGELEGSTEGYSIEFNGCDWCDDYINFGDIHDMGYNSFSYSVWVNMKSVGVNWQQNIISKGLTGGGSPPDNGFKLSLLPNTDYLRAVIGTGSSQFYSVISDPIDINTWYYITVIVDRNSNIMRLFVNGELQNSENLSLLENLSNNGHLHAGNQYWAVSGQNAAVFDGLISDIAFWDYSLDTFEIHQYMTCPPTGSEEGLISYWNFEEGTDNTAYDLSGNGNHGTINGATYSDDTPEQNCVAGCSSSDSVVVTFDICACADPEAMNYDETATQDDGSCIYCQNEIISGLSNGVACPGDTISIYGDNFCLPVGIHLQGWTIPEEFIVSTSMTEIVWVVPNDLESFNIVQTVYDSEDGLIYSNTLPLVNGIYGCTDINSINYDSLATCENDSCIPIVEGCTDENACNYNDTANTDDDSCAYNSFSLSEVEACDLFTWNGEAYASSGSYSFTTVNTMGCDSTATLELTINSSEIVEIDVIACDSFEWNGTIYNESGTYSYSTGASNNYSMSFDGVDDEVICNNPLQPNMSEITIMFFAKFSSTNYATLITDWPAGGATFKIDTYSDKLRFDIITSVGYYQTLHTLSTDDFNAWINWAYTYNGDTAKVYKNGVLVEVSTSLDGTISPSSSVIRFANEENNPAFWNGYMDEPHFWNIALTEQEVQNYMSCPPTGNETGLVGYWNFEQGSGTTAYDQTSNGNNGALVNSATWSTSTPAQPCGLTNANGCDSTAILNLTILESTFGSSSIVSCYEYYWNEQLITETGDYVQSFTNAAGCDSTHVLSATINYTTYGTDIIEACDIYEWIDGNVYTNSTNSPTITLQNEEGCDHIVSLDLTILNTSHSNTNEIACTSFAWNGNVYTSSGIYIFEAVNSFGCDSIAALDLTILESTFGSSSIVSCDEYYWNDLLITETGDYDQTFINEVGCDSTHVLSATINYTTYGTDVIEACDSYEWIDGNVYTNITNSPTFTLQNEDGCDYIVTLDLTILYSDESMTLVTECDSFEWNGEVYANSGVYQYSTLNSEGCDSLATLDLTILESTFGSSSTVSCDEYYWNGQLITESGDYVQSFTNASGCDSTHVLSATINYTTYGTDVIEACDSYEWIDGNVYTNSTNAPTFTLQNEDGCDYIVTLYLTILDNDESMTLVTECDSFEWNGEVYESSGVYQYSTLNSEGCDSTATLDLTILESTLGSSSIVSCDDYNWNGQLITESGDYVQSLTNAAGCDSTHVLSASINYTTYGTDIIEVCDSYEWIDGNVYTNSTNSPTFTLQNQDGCDHIVTLELTISNSSIGLSNIESCDSYDWNGQLITASGDYIQVFENSVGCDSTHTLIAIINYSSSGVDEVTACDSFEWIDGMTYNESNNTATYILENESGCDSLVSLDLTINESFELFYDISICQGDSIEIGNSVYFEAGSYVDIFSTEEGCDSTINTILKVDSTYLVEQFFEICEGETIEINDLEISEGGVYYDSLVTNEGCDSLVVSTVEIFSAPPTSQISGILLALVPQSSYSIDGLEDSWYEWGTDLGTIFSGQGTQEIVIDWDVLQGIASVWVTEMFANGCIGETIFVNITLDITDGVEEIGGDNGIAVFPNPFRDATTIKFNNPNGEAYQVTLIDERGRLLRTYSNVISGELIIERQGLAQGIYFIQLSGDSNVMRATIVVQ